MTHTTTHVYDTAPCGHRTPIPNDAYADWVTVSCDGGHDHVVTVEVVDGVPTTRWRYPKMPCVAVTGDPWAGMHVHGPFARAADAETWLEGIDVSGHVVELEAP